MEGVFVGKRGKDSKSAFQSTLKIYLLPLVLQTLFKIQGKAITG